MTMLLVASFDHAAPFRQAVDMLRRDQRIVDVWSPMPVDLGDEPDRAIIPTTAIAGAVGAVLLYLLTWWNVVYAYVLNSGGRPLHSWPAFLIAPVEFGALIAGAAGVVAFLVRGGLTRLNDPAFDIAEVAAASADRFVIAVRVDEGEDANDTIARLAESGAVHSRLVTP